MTWSRDISADRESPLRRYSFYFVSSIMSSLLLVTNLVMASGASGW